MYKYLGKITNRCTNTIRLIIHRIEDFQENIGNTKTSTLINMCISLNLQKYFRHCKNRSSSDLQITIPFFFFSFNVGKFQKFQHLNPTPMA